MEDFRINITTSADTTGAKAVADSLQGVSKAAAETGKSTATAGKEILSLGETTEKGIGIGRMFAEVARGNVLALLNLTSALKVTGAALKTNFVGILLLAVTALANFLQGMRDTTKSAEEAAPKLDEASEAVARLNAQKLESLKAQIDAITAATKAALDYFGQIDAAASKVDKAREALAIAQIENDPKLNADQKKAAIFNVRQEFADRASTREREALQERVALAEREAQQKAGVVAETEGARSAVSARVEGTIARRAGLNTSIRNLNAEFLASLVANADNPEARIASRQRYDERLAPLQVSQSVAFGPEADARLKALQEELKGAEERAKLAREDAARAEAALLSARQGLDIDQNTRPIVRGLDRQAARISAGLPAPVSATGSSASVTGGELTVRGINGEAVGNRIAAIVDQRMREGEEAIVRAFERRLAETQKIQEQQTKSLRR